MKYFNYIALLLLVAVTMGSCDKKDVSYMAEPVDEGQMAYVQIGYYAPIVNSTANSIYFIDLNGVEYGNNGSSFLATYNTVPSMATNRYYVVKAGKLNVKLHSRVSDGEGGYTYPEVYNQDVNIEAGKRYVLNVYDMNKPPIATEVTAAPEFSPGLDTDSLCRLQFINMIFEADNTPITDKVQFGIENLDSMKYEPVGEPVAFGEVTSWIPVKIRKTIHNSSGYQNRKLCLYRIDANTGKNLGVLQYTKDDGSTAEFYTTVYDSFNKSYWYIGRAYRNIGAGNCSSKSIRCALYQFIIE